LACEICEGWFHASCVKINDGQYKVMQELATCHWFCQLCDTKLGKIIPSIVRLSDRVTEVDKIVSSVEKEISVYCDKVEKVTEDVNKRVSDADSHVVKIERDIKVMTGHITKMKEDMTKDLQKLATDVNIVKEEVDKKLTSNHKDINDISSKISDIFRNKQTTGVKW